MTLEWKEVYSVGVPAVDHEHKELIGLVSQLHEALSSGRPVDAVEEAFGELLRSISSHFALEERFMREHRYDERPQHKADHERLLDELRDIMDDFRRGESDAAQHLADSLEAWFVNHFKTHDARLHSRLGDHPH